MQQEAQARGFQVPAIFQRFGRKPQVEIPGVGEQTISPDLDSLSQELTETFRIIYALEGKNRKDMIDFDLAPPTRPVDRLKAVINRPPTRALLRETVSWLEEDIEKAQQTEIPQDERLAMQREFLIDKLNAHRVFIEGRLGSKIPWSQRLEATQGVTPLFIDRETIETQMTTARAVFEELGYSDLSPQEIKRYQKEHQAQYDEFAGIMVENSAQVFESISDFLGRKIEPAFRVEADNKDEYWLNWSDGVSGDFRLRVNIHPRHQQKITRGKAYAMLIHEVGGHFAQMEGWSQAIKEKRTLGALGVTSTHDPEQVISEGAAMYMHGLVKDIQRVVPESADFELDLEGGRQMIYNNVHIAVNLLKDAREQGLDPQQVVAVLPEDMQRFFPKDLSKVLDKAIIDRIMTRYVHSLYAAEPDQEVARQISERTEDANKSVYLYAYGFGFILNKAIADTLDEDDRRKYVDLIFSQPISPNQAIRYVRGLMDKKPQQYSSKQFPFEAAA